MSFVLYSDKVPDEPYRKSEHNNNVVQVNHTKQNIFMWRHRPHHV